MTRPPSASNAPGHGRPAAWVIVIAAVSLWAASATCVAQPPTRIDLSLTPEQRAALRDEAGAMIARAAGVAADDPVDAQGWYARAADKLALLTDAGGPDGPSLYDLGTAQLLAGDAPAAVASLTRAAAYLPGDRRVQTNLTLARDLAGVPAANAGGAWGKAAWDTAVSAAAWLPVSGRWIATAALWNAAWALAAVALWRRRSAWAASAAGVGLAAAIAGATIALPVIDARQSPEIGVVVADDAQLRTGDGLAFDPIDTPLPPGSPVRVIEARGDWLRVDAGGLAGWLPRDKAQLVERPPLM